MSFCWIASYPKSGNTWLRFLLYSYFRGEAKKSGDVEKFIPDIHAMTSPEDLYSNKPLFTKTHFKFSEEFASLMPDAKAIYIYRNPKNVLLSNLNYFKIRGNELVDDRSFIHEFIENKGVKLWIDSYMGSWPEHLESWTTQKTMPVLVLEYEELKTTPDKTFSDVLNFIGKTPTKEKIKRAIYLSSFERMQTLERKEKHKDIFNSVFSGTDQASKKGLWFMNSGKSTASLKQISPELDKHFDDVFEPYIKQFSELKKSKFT